MVRRQRERTGDRARQRAASRRRCSTARSCCASRCRRFRRSSRASPQQLIQLSSNAAGDSPSDHGQLAGHASCSTFARKTSCCPAASTQSSATCSREPHAALRADVEPNGSGAPRANRNHLRRRERRPRARSSIPPSCEISGPRAGRASDSVGATTRTTIAYPDSQTHLVDIDTTALGAGVRVRPTQVEGQLTFILARRIPDAQFSGSRRRATRRRRRCSTERATTPRLRSLVILSQDVHRIFGGVVPEIASRAHLTSIVPVVERALADAGVGSTTSMRSR